MIKAVYVNSYDEYQKFGRFHTFVGRKKHMLTYSIIFLAIALIFFLLTFFRIANFVSGIILCLLFAILLPLFNYLMQYLKIRKLIKNNQNFSKIKNYYEFEENSFKVTVVCGKREEINNFEYNRLYRVYETKSNYYLYLNSVSALIVSKNSIDGSLDELNNIFEKNLNKSFIKKKKRR